MTRPNVLYPWDNGPVRFVGGVPSRHVQAGLVEESALDVIHEGELRGREPIFSDGATWVRVHVPGMGDDLLVPVGNLRW